MRRSHRSLGDLANQVSPAPVAGECCRWSGSWPWSLQAARSAPAWTLADSALVTVTRGSNTTPSFGDLDGDGLVDLVIGKASAAINLYKNVGTKTSPKFTLVSDHFQDIKVGRRSAPVLRSTWTVTESWTCSYGATTGTSSCGEALADREEIRFERDSSFSLKSYPECDARRR